MLLNRLVNINGIKGRNIKSCEPHINNYGDFEIGLDILKLTVEFFSIFFCAEHFVQFRLIIFIASHNHSDFFDGLQLFLIFLREFSAVGTDFLFCPFRAKFDNNFIKGISNIAVGTDEHSLACNRCTLFNTVFVMLYEVLCYGTKPVGIANDDFHISNRFFAFLDLVFVCTIVLAFGIVVLNLLNFCLVKSYTGCTTVINKINCDTVTNRLSHCIRVHNAAKDFDCRINRRSREADISSVG